MPDAANHENFIYHATDLNKNGEKVGNDGKKKKKNGKKGTRGL